LKVRAFLAVTAFYISFFHNLVNNKKLLLKLVQNWKLWLSHPPLSPSRGPLCVSYTKNPYEN